MDNVINLSEYKEKKIRKAFDNMVTTVSPPVDFWDMIKNQKPLDPDFAKVVDDNFWDLI